MKILVLLIMIQVKAKQIIYSQLESDQYEYMWKFSGYNSNCCQGKWFSDIIFGGCNCPGCNSNYQRFMFTTLTEITILISLPPHYKLYIDFTFYKIKSWNGCTFNTYIDDQLIHTRAFTTNSSSLSFCGISITDFEKIQISTQTAHTKNYATLKFKPVGDDSVLDEFWGIKDLTISVEKCPDGCLYCESYSLQKCTQWSFFYGNVRLSENEIQNFGERLIVWQYFSKYINLKLKLPEHQKVMINLELLVPNNTQVQTIQISIDSTLVLTKSITPDLLSSIWQEINFPPFTHLNQNLFLEIFFSPLQQSYIYSINVMIYNNLNAIKKEGCQQQIEYKCLECEIGWIMDEITSECIPQCGDEIIVADEECDHLSNNPECYNCRFLCVEFCADCKFGICNMCIEGFYLDFNNICQTTNLISYFEIEKQCQDGWDKNNILFDCISCCGDGIIQVEEECDDGNNLQNDGCFNCKLQCVQNCAVCIFGICKMCDQGFDFDFNNICQTTNLISYFQNEEQCLDGWSFDIFKFICIPTCGDGIVQVNEECDDGNNLYNDGCFSCKLQCVENCAVCVFGICKMCHERFYFDSNNFCSKPNLISYNEKQCQDGWNFDIFQFICIPTCGDGIVQMNEECDDGNNIQNDGCFNCKLQCIENCAVCVFGICEICHEGFYLDSINVCLTTLISNFPIEKQCQDGWNFDNILFNCFPICGDGIVQVNEDCDDGNNLQNDGCFNCKLHCVENCAVCVLGICKMCHEGFYLDSNSICLTPYLITQFEQQCQDDGVVQMHEECDDGNNIQNDGCFNCKLQCIENCAVCVFGICEICHEGFYFNSNYICLTTLISYFPIVKQCQEGWNFDEILFNCIPTCGDGIVQMNEDCDDGNNLQNDGCFNCKLQCVENCSVCMLGICKSCLQGYYLDENNQCSNVCSDGMVIPYKEECDDLNLIDGDGCSDCILDCEKSCKDCQYGICLACGYGMKLESGECFSVCGDKIVVQNLEECDDGNNIQYDGCYDCQYQCYQNCQICEKGQCLDQCPPGEIFVNQVCHSVCGNQIVTGDEDCDDGNSIQYDGCYQCRYSCIKYCGECIAGVCQECQIDYKLQNNTCIMTEQCGNGQIGSQERCDDGNLLPNDGCYLCQIEQNWMCGTSAPSICAFSYQPQMIAVLVHSTASIYQISVTFSQMVKINSEQPLSETMNITIQQLSLADYSFSINPIYDASQELAFVEYQINIETYQFMIVKPVAIVDLNQNVYNQYNQSIISTQSAVKLNLPSYLTKEQKSSAQKLANFGQNVVLILAIIAITTLFTGDSSVFQEILNSLQYLSYLRFINIQFPQNLVLFFQISDSVSISPLTDFIHFNSFIEFVLMDSDSSEASGKFKLYNVNVDLINNLQSQMMQCIGLLLIIVLIKLIREFYFNDKYISKYYYLVSCLFLKINEKIVFQLNKVLLILIKNFKKITNLISKQGLTNILLLNSWDLLYKTILFFNYSSKSSIRGIIMTFISSLILLTYFNMILSYLNQQQTKKEFKVQKQCMVVSLGKQMFFFFFLIIFQDQYVIQTLGIASLSTIYFLFILNRGGESSLIDLIVEGTVIVFTITSFIYFDEFSLLCTPEQKNIIGFLHIVILSTGLMAQVIKFSLGKGQQIVRAIKKRLNENKKNPNLKIVEFYAIEF